MSRAAPAGLALRRTAAGAVASERAVDADGSTCFARSVEATFVLPASCALLAALPMDQRGSVRLPSTLAACDARSTPSVVTTHLKRRQTPAAAAESENGRRKALRSLRARWHRRISGFCRPPPARAGYRASRVDAASPRRSSSVHSAALPLLIPAGDARDGGDAAGGPRPAEPHLAGRARSAPLDPHRAQPLSRTSGLLPLLLPRGQAGGPPTLAARDARHS